MRKTIPVAFAILLAAAPAHAKPLPHAYIGTVASVYDGDTLTASIEIWPGQVVTAAIRIRGIDTPEAGGRAKCDAERELAERAKAMTTALATKGPVSITALDNDKYGGRYDASVATADGQDIGVALIAAGLARAYEGGKREGWCGN